MEEEKVAENHLTSAAAFIEGGIQEACDDACSICLEAFCDSDPPTLTSCKHEFHLQCILEWCQRSSQCPMCWQPISLKDTNSQELLDALEHERNIRMKPPRNTAIFHHPTLGDFELQHLPVNGSEFELEERIIQHLAATAAMGRAQHISQRGHRNRSSDRGRPQFLVFSTDPNGSSAMSIDDPSNVSRESSNVGTSNNRTPAQTSPTAQGRARPSDFNTFSESLKSRLSAFSMRYKESVTKSTRGWKERIFNRNSKSPEARNDEHNHREANRASNNSQSITTVSRMMDHLDITEYDRMNDIAPSNNSANIATLSGTETQATEAENNHSLHEDNARTPRRAECIFILQIRNFSNSWLVFSTSFDYWIGLMYLIRGLSCYC